MEHYKQIHIQPLSSASVQERFLLVCNRRHYEAGAPVVTPVALCLLAVGIKEMTMSIMPAEPAVMLLVLLLLALLQAKDDGQEPLRAQKIPSSPWRYIPVVVGCVGWGILTVGERRLQACDEMTVRACEAWEEGKFAEVAGLLEQALDGWPHCINRAVWAAFAPDSVLPEGYRKEIRKELDRVGTDEDLYVGFLSARLAWLEGERAEAVGTLRSLADSFPRNASFAYQLAWMLYETGRKEEAAERLCRVVWLRPDWLRTEETDGLFSADPDFGRKVKQGLTIQLAETEGTDWPRCGVGILVHVRHGYGLAACRFRRGEGRGMPVRCAG